MATENNQFQIIHLGNPYDFVVKNNNTNKTYGTFQGDDKSLMELLNELHNENKELQERNNRQAETIRELYNLIKNKDWETLTAHMMELKKAEEQLQSEWQTYGG